MRILFAGTPEVAVPSLRALLDSPHEVVAVLTRPDARSGRGRTLRPSPVRVLAEEEGVPVLTPDSLRGEDVLSQLRALDVEAAAVVAYGNLVPPAALAIPPHGWVNLHFSLLPAWRGAAPAQRAVLAGQESTGMTTFLLEKGMDTGPVLATRDVAIDPFETAGSLLDRMAVDGAPLLVETLDALADGTARPVPQDDGGATRAAKLTPAEAELDLGLPAPEVSARIRGMSPHPGAWTTWEGQRMKVLGVEPVRSEAPPLSPGRLHATRTQLLIGTGSEPLALDRIAPAGRRPMRAADWARGAGLTEDSSFGAADRCADDPADSPADRPVDEQETTR
ncbi:methionyl-tRNA formyltransferase [Brachybacterium halotolerans subsp. kimchii]|uniref:methionyl-tRNA formyltransferase n=1 Tax=Brachybacterium halotolerans TaxID=2795215 RepID=UPI001E2F7CA9|nr:methionyl-tRNA formyltransferase [Brachybacterium halotolerans]UEJ83167.1 methionyl-tRNA formyltransferase [Brachybacterium halotolerans subsp. kimchii]